MKNNIITLVLAFFISLTYSQPCPDSLYITSQEEIDNFQVNYPGCNTIPGNVMIAGEDIIHLDGLEVLIKIGGDLSIGNIGYQVETNINLSSLIGLA